MPSYKKKPNGKWLCTAMIDGVRYSAVADTKAEATFQANLKAIEKKEQKEKKPTLQTAFEDYVELKRKVLSPTTIESYESIVRSKFCSLQSKHLDEIIAGDIQAEINSMLLNGNSPKTIKNSFRFLTAVLNHNKIKIDLDGIAMPKQRKVVYTTPEPDTAKKIIQAVKGTEMEIPVLLAMWLGLRASEICGIKYNKVKKNCIIIDTVRVFAHGAVTEKAPKTESSVRQIPIPEYLYKLIMKNKNGEYVVNVNPNALAKRFSKALKSANLPHIRFHDLRHFNASTMKQLNIPDIYAMQRGGWSSNSVYTNIYSQVFEDEQLKVADKIDKYFMQMI